VLTAMRRAYHRSNAPTPGGTFRLKCPKQASQQAVRGEGGWLEEASGERYYVARPAGEDTGLVTASS